MLLRTRAWTIADRPKPKISDQRICHVIPPATGECMPDGVDNPHRRQLGWAGHEESERVAPLGQVLPAD